MFALRYDVPMDNNRGGGITSWEYLETGDYLAVDLGGKTQSFFIMQHDGNICWYKGTGPSDNRGKIWSAFKVSQGNGDYCLALDGNGNLAAYRGTSPTDNSGMIWQTGTSEAAGTYYLALCAMTDSLNANSLPTIGVFAEDPYKNVVTKALWKEQTAWSL